MRHVWGIMLVLGLSLACKPRIEYVVVKTPVAVPVPEPPVLIWPDLPTKHLTKTSTDAEVAKAYAATVWLLVGRLAEAYTIINGYRTLTPTTDIPK